jgi:hypothetical protein
MIEVKKFEPSDLDGFDPVHVDFPFTEQNWEKCKDSLAKVKDVYSIRRNGKTLMIVGAYPIAFAVREVFCLFAKGPKGQAMLAMMQAKKMLNRLQGRLQMVTPKQSNWGKKWATYLGFRLEAETLKAYGWDGSDYSLYARINS